METTFPDAMRGQTALLMGVGERLTPEWDRNDVPVAAGRLIDPMRDFATSDELTVIRFGDRAVIERTTFDAFAEPASRARRMLEECGPGDNLPGALHAALSQRVGHTPLNVYGVSDYHLDPERIEELKAILRAAPNVTFIVVRIGTDGVGQDEANQLDVFQSGKDDSVEAVYYNDGKGRDIGHDLKRQIRLRMEMLHGRRFPAARLRTAVPVAASA
jgi:hypothetical protein